jgi:hypothetical protein
MSKIKARTKKTGKKKYKVFASSHHGCTVGRIKMENVKTIPDFKKLDIMYPYEMPDGCTDECMMNDNQIWFEDECGKEVARFLISPQGENGIKYIDGGEIFDESDKKTPYFYHLQIQDKWSWSYQKLLEVDGEIDPTKISVVFKRMRDGDGDEHRLIDYGDICYDGKTLGTAYMVDDWGTDGDSFWTVYKNKRTIAKRPRFPDDNDDE